MMIQGSGLRGLYRINDALFDIIKDSQSKHTADFQIEKRDDNGVGGDDEDEDKDDKDEDKDEDDEDDN